MCDIFAIERESSILVLESCEELTRSYDEVDTFHASVDKTFSGVPPDEGKPESYLSRFELRCKYYAISADNKDTKKVFLFNFIGPEAYDLLMDHFGAHTILEISYDEIIKCLTNYYGQNVPWISQRKIFYSHKRGCGEDVKSYTKRAEKEGQWV
ncbi:hypothetical protein RF11_07664 [Thelohanellus kitauei]|uniref:Uncharacterized protein n=1 Tax=Thelohanellus kitauei TaxID=669202 RepID=A0A0C2IPE1_THEKT|nr:hypothetical protein RF11_07664 [Thelohanellus kitauei]